MRERQAQIVAEARERTDQITASTDEARTTELETQHDTAMAEYDRLETLIQREEHVAELEARAAEREAGERPRQRPNGGDRQAPAGGGGEQIRRAHVELQSLMRISYAVFCLKKHNTDTNINVKTSHKQ